MAAAAVLRLDDGGANVGADALAQRLRRTRRERQRDEQAQERDA